MKRKAYRDAALSHQAHLTVAVWYLMHYAQPEAKSYIREGIQKYNAATGIETTPNSGYHETMTLFWTTLVAKYLANKSINSCIVDTVNEVISLLSDRTLPFKYYSRHRLLSSTARTTWVEPDLQALV